MRMTWKLSSVVIRVFAVGCGRHGLGSGGTPMQGNTGTEFRQYGLVCSGFQAAKLNVAMWLWRGRLWLLSGY